MIEIKVSELLEHYEWAFSYMNNLSFKIERFDGFEDFKGFIDKKFERVEEIFNSIENGEEIKLIDDREN